MSKNIIKIDKDKFLELAYKTKNIFNFGYYLEKALDKATIPEEPKEECKHVLAYGSSPETMYCNDCGAKVEGHTEPVEHCELCKPTPEPEEPKSKVPEGIENYYWVKKTTEEKIEELANLVESIISYLKEKEGQ